MMNKLRKSFRESFRRKKKDRTPESSKPHQWEDDEKSVRAGDCSFPVKYLGNVEVFEPRGMQVCEEALKILRASRKRPIKGQLYVTGDGLRVVDDEKKGLIVDQTIEKVSFCAPDRQNEKGFSYICRDGTTRRWMCHGFHAESGERLSHAVGCAFAICLERKREREKRNLMASSNVPSSNQGASSSTGLNSQQSSSQSQSHQQLTQNQPALSSSTSNGFQRNGPLRQSASISQRLKDPQISKPIVLKPAVKPVVNPYAIERPHATPQLLERQGSFRGFSALSSASPFKRQLSLRLTELPSTIARQSRSSSIATGGNHKNDASSGYSNSSLVTSPPSTAPRSEFSTATALPEQIDNSLVSSNDVTSVNSTISEMCKELTQGLSILTNDELNGTVSGGDELAFTSPTHSIVSSDSSVKGTQGISTVTVASNALPVKPTPLPKSPLVPSKSPAAVSPATRRYLTTRSMSLTTNSSPNNIGPKIRRPVPPPPSSTAVAINDRKSTIPKLAAVSTSSFANTVDLGSIIPNDIDDPFDAEWTNVITNLTHSSVKSASSDATDLVSNESNTLTQNETKTTTDTSSVSTNPFTIEAVSPVTSGHNSPGLKKEFDIKM